MMLNGSFTRLISLVSVLSVLYQNVDAVADLSESARILFRSEPPPDAPDHLLKGYYKEYVEVQNQIHASLLERNLIHVQDGEGDDIVHDTLSVLKGHIPSQVYLVSGYYQVRKKCTEMYWDHLAEQGSFQRPNIFTLRGTLEQKDLSAFDKAEGAGLLTQNQLDALRKSSFDTGAHIKAVEEAKEMLRQTLDKNDFTTIVLKTAPGEMADVLKEFENKVAIIWTGPLRKQAAGDNWEAKYNYIRANYDSDTLLQTSIPIVMTSPYFGGSQLEFIVDKAFRKEYVQATKSNSLVQGFDKLGSLDYSNPEKVIAFYTKKLANSLMQSIIEASKPNEEKYAKLLEEYDKYGGEQRWNDMTNFVASKLALPRRWKEFLRLEKERNGVPMQFHELCPVDPTAVVVTDPSLSESVKEVMKIKIERNQGSSELFITPDYDHERKIFMVTHLDSRLLELRIQRFIDWMDDGEPEFNPSENLYSKLDNY